MKAELDTLMQEFPALGDADVGRGQRHPTAPQAGLKTEIDAFIDKYPFLRRDPGYVEFLQRYAGASLEAQRGRALVSIFGFDWNVGLHLTDEEGPVVDEGGFYAFATAQVLTHPNADSQVLTHPNADSVDRYTDLGFMFDATGGRRAGVYRTVGGEDPAWDCADFLAWLGKVVERRGVLADTPEASLC